VFFLSSGLVRIPVDQQGAPEGQLYGLATELALHSHRVVIVDRMYSNDLKQIEFVRPGLVVYRIHVKYFRVSKVERISGSRFLYWLRTGFFTFLKVVCTIPVIRMIEPDVINTFAIFETFLLLMFAPRYRARVVYNHHSSYFPSKGIAGALMHGIARRVVRRCGGIIVLTRFAERWFKSIGGVNVAVIPPGLNVSQNPQVTSRKGNILFVGRITKDKGVDTLIQAFGLLSYMHGYNGEKLILVGPLESHEKGPHGSFTRYVFDLVKSLGLSSKVIFTGRVRAQDLQTLLAGCEVFVLPSRIENSSVASLEAMSYAKPVISTRTPSGLAQVVPGWNGILVPIDDVKMMADSMHFLLANPTLAKKMGENAKKSVARNDWRFLVKEHLDFYYKLRRKR
jgi:glycosyltransferase involved in cell wall biosynthesis